MKLNLWAEYQSRILWYFMAFAFGIMTYFGLWFEPHIMCVGVGCLALFISHYFYPSVFIRILLFFCLGMCVITLRTSFIHTGRMVFPRWNSQMTVKVVEVSPQVSSQIIVVETISMKGKGFRPHRARLKFEQSHPELHKGDIISVKAHLYGPFLTQARRFFYQGIEAQGKILQILYHQSKPEGTLDRWRRVIMAHLLKILPTKQAQIAIPLTVGEQRVVPQSLYDVYRRAGIVHILSVSGFHMALLAGFVFFLIRGILAFIPAIALRISTKKIAAVVAFFITWFYLLLSGAQVPALRAFLMISCVFLGIIVNRKTVSLYSLMLVGFGILLFRPEWIVSVSFQLSFVAVMVLVGMCHYCPKNFEKLTFFRWIWFIIKANVLVSLVLAPFVIYHFNQLNPYGLIGNLLTSMFFSFLIMPLLFVGVMLMPFGCDSVFFKLAGMVLEWVTGIAKIISNWSYSEILLPSFSSVGLCIVAFGVSMLCLMHTRVRWWGFAVAGIGLVMGYALADKPDLLVSQKGEILAVRDGEHVLAQFKKKAPISITRWAKQLGISQVDKWKGDRIFLKGKKVSLSDQDCIGADLAILAKSNKNCSASKILVPKKYELYNIYLTDSIRIEGDWSQDQDRPWGVHLNRKEKTG